MASASLRKRPASKRCLVLRGIDWRTYTRLLRLLADQRGLRLTYDRGTLEMMSPLHEHESDADMLGRFVAVLSEEQNVAVKAARSTTLRKRRKQQGLEPDHSWWITNEFRVRGKRRIDLRVDPPPDLAVEVDVTSSSDRMKIYAALGVPEVWRLDARGLTFQVLQANGQYASQQCSLAFPLVTPTDLVGFLSERTSSDETTVIRRFRSWVQQRLKQGSGSTSAP